MYSQYDSTLKPKKPSYIAALDGIRAIAILLVLFSHSVIFDQFIWLHNIGQINDSKNKSELTRFFYNMDKTKLDVGTHFSPSTI